MKEKYNENGRVVEVHLTNSPETISPIDGRASIALKNRTEGTEVSIECFLGGHEELEKWGKITKEDSILLRLILLNWQYTSTRSAPLRRKEVTYLGKCEYRIKGEILELETHPHYEDSLAVMLDCGVYIQTRVGKNLDLKVGDYMSAEGRLDAHIVGKVN